MSRFLKCEIGDIIRIPGPVNQWYVQYVFYWDGIGEIFVVLGPKYPEDDEALETASNAGFMTGIVIESEGRYGQCEVVGTADVAVGRPKYYRQSVALCSSEGDLGWNIISMVDESARYTAQLTIEERRLPEPGGMLGSALAERLERGWRAEEFERYISAESLDLLETEEPSQEPHTGFLVEHTLLLPTHEAVERVVRRLGRFEISVLDADDDDDDWVVTVSRRYSSSGGLVVRLDEWRLSRLAKRHGGVYDGRGTWLR